MSYRLLACLPIVLLAACSKSGEKSAATPTEAPALPKLVLTGEEGYHNAINCGVKGHALSQAYSDLADVTSDIQIKAQMREFSAAHAADDLTYFPYAAGIRGQARSLADRDAEQKAQEALVTKERASRPLKDYTEWLEREFARCSPPPSGA